MRQRGKNTKEISPAKQWHSASQLATAMITRSPAVAETADRTVYNALINDHLDINHNSQYFPMFVAIQTKCHVIKTTRYNK